MGRRHHSSGGSDNLSTQGAGTNWWEDITWDDVTHKAAVAAKGVEKGVAQIPGGVAQVGIWSGQAMTWVAGFVSEDARKSHEALVNYGHVFVEDVNKQMEEVRQKADRFTGWDGPEIKTKADEDVDTGFQIVGGLGAPAGAAVKGGKVIKSLMTTFKSSADDVAGAAAKTAAKKTAKETAEKATGATAQKASVEAAEVAADVFLSKSAALKAMPKAARKEAQKILKTRQTTVGEKIEGLFSSDKIDPKDAEKLSKGFLDSMRKRGQITSADVDKLNLSRVPDAVKDAAAKARLDQVRTAESGLGLGAKMQDVRHGLASVAERPVVSAVKATTYPIRHPLTTAKYTVGATATGAAAYYGGGYVIDKAAAALGGDDDAPAERAPARGQPGAGNPTSTTTTTSSDDTSTLGWIGDKIEDNLVYPLLDELGLDDEYTMAKGWVKGMFNTLAPDTGGALDWAKQHPIMSFLGGLFALKMLGNVGGNLLGGIGGNIGTIALVIGGILLAGKLSGYLNAPSHLTDGNQALDRTLVTQLTNGTGVDPRSFDFNHDGKYALSELQQFKDNSPQEFQKLNQDPLQNLNLA